MNGVIALTGGQLPAYLKGFAEQAAAINDEVNNFASFGQLSIKGKVWTLRQGDEAKILKKPDAPDETAQYVEGVMIRINDKARTFYKKKYSAQADAEGEKPTCYSNDGVTPSQLSVERQNPTCQGCQWAAFGTAVDEAGNARKGSACASNARVAFAQPDALDKPFMLRVPPTSLKPMRDAIKVCRDRSIPYAVLVWKLGFVAEETQPVLSFRPVGILEEAIAHKVVGLRDDSTVKAICGLEERTPAAAPAVAPAPVQAASAPVTTAEAVSGDLDALLGLKATAAPAPTPVPAPAPAPVAQAVVSPAPAPVVLPTPPAAAPATVVVTSGANDPLADLNALLGSFDDAPKP